MVAGSSPRQAAIIAGKIANLMAVPENTDPLVSLEVYGHVFPDWYHRGYRRLMLTAPKLNRMTRDDSADIKARETALPDAAGKTNCCKPLTLV